MEIEWIGKKHQLEKEVLGNPVEEIDILHNRVEQIMCNAGTNGSRQPLQRLMLFQSFCFEFETHV